MNSISDAGCRTVYISSQSIILINLSIFFKYLQQLDFNFDKVSSNLNIELMIIHKNTFRHNVSNKHPIFLKQVSNSTAQSPPSNTPTRDRQTRMFANSQTSRRIT